MDVQEYFLRRLEERGYNGISYSNRYGGWRRFLDLEREFGDELRRRGAAAAIRTLEVGCGDGWLIYYLIARFGQKFSLEFMGIDLSEFDIDFALRRKAHVSLENCAFKVMPAECLEFGDASYDVVISTELIEHLREPERSLREMFRVLAPGGLLVITSPNGGGGIGARSGRWANRISRGMWHRLFYGRDAAEPLNVPHAAGDIRFDHVSVKGYGEWGRLLREAGFRVEGARGTGGLIFGNPAVDRHPVLVAATMVADSFLRFFPGSWRWCELLLICARKP